MADDQDFEGRFERRLRDYAATESRRAGPPDLDALGTRQRSTRFRPLTVAGTIALGAAAAVVLTFVLSTTRPTGLDPSPVPSGDVASQVPTASVSPQPSQVDSPAASVSPQPTASEPQPTAVAITGETPPEDAEPPAGTTHIAGLEAQALWTTLIDAGYSCNSVSGAHQSHDPPGWSIECTRNVAGAQATVSAPYWTFEHVVGVTAFILPDPIDGSIGDPSFYRDEASRLAALEYDGADPAAASAWVGQMVGDPGCVEVPCQQVIGEARFAVQTGERGSGSIGLDGLSPVD